MLVTQIKVVIAECGTREEVWYLLQVVPLELLTVWTTGWPNASHCPKRLNNTQQTALLGLTNIIRKVLEKISLETLKL